MNIFLRRIAASTKRAEIYEFVAPALNNGLFRKSGRILNIDILALRDLRTGSVEHHGLVAVDSQRSLQQSIQHLQDRRLNGKAVQVRPYYHRSWYNDPRLHDVMPTSEFVEQRNGDRRRGSFIEIVKHVSDHFVTENVESTTLHRQHYLASFIVPAELETMIAGYFANAKLEPQPLAIHNAMNLGDSRYLAAPLSAENTAKFFQIYAEKHEIYALLDKLRNQCRDAGIQYWITSIAESGEI